MKIITFNSGKWIHAYSFLTAVSLLIAGFACNNNTSLGEGTEPALTEENAADQSEQINFLTENEKNEGWKLLFDGKTTNGWIGANKKSFPEKGWVIEDGILTVLGTDGEGHVSGGDIITIGQYDNFELSLDFKIPEGANSGIKYFVVDDYPNHQGAVLGLEYQILDDERHPDAKNGVNGNRTVASLYDLIPAKGKSMTIGEWNRARIVAQGYQVEHWLNGNKVVEFMRGSEEFKALVAKSKYKDYENFGEVPKGHILLQGHGDTVHFRNIKIRNLTGS